MAALYKTYSANFIEVSLPEFSHFPTDYQRAIHEFRNQLHLLNQDIEADQKRFWMSFDSNVEPDNQEALRKASEHAEKGMEFRFERVAQCLSAMIEHPLAEN